MSFAPIAHTMPQYEDFVNYWVKAYDQGTTTPKLMATDSTGGTTAAKFEVGTEGFFETSGGALVIPFIDGAYDLWLFPTEALADANDTTLATQLADDITAGNDLVSNNTWTGTNDFSTLTVNGNTVFHEGNINEAVVPINAQEVTSYVFVLGDRGGLLTMDHADPNTVTLPPEASVPYPEGTVLFGNQKGAGQTTIVEGSGVTILRPVSKGLVVAEQGEWWALIKIAGVDNWLLAGTTV